LREGEALPEFRFTSYFENEVLRKRAYLKKEDCVRVVREPLRTVPQPDGCVRHSGKVGDRY
jgi:hypothetical protein